MGPQMGHIWCTEKSTKEKVKFENGVDPAGTEDKKKMGKK